MEGLKSGLGVSRNSKTRAVAAAVVAVAAGAVAAAAR